MPEYIHRNIFEIEHYVSLETGMYVELTNGRIAKVVNIGTANTPSIISSNRRKTTRLNVTIPRIQIRMRRHDNKTIWIGYNSIKAVYTGIKDH